MDIMEMSILHHVAIVLLSLWFLSEFKWCHPVAYFVALIYLYLVHDRYITRLQKKLQFEERKQANQRRVLSDSETVRWLNHAVEKIWPICMEQVASQKILLPIIPWFLQKYKPWTAKEAVVQQLYLGRNPPMFTEIRVVRQFTDDDHLVLELGMNFLTADDMSAILAVKLRKRLGFGMWAKMHITGMHVEGKVLIGVKFLQGWPFIERLRICFIEPPYFEMTVKPIFTHGLDVTELPGIAGWLDKLLSVAFEQTLVEPNMLVVDMVKFASPQPESWFSVDEKEPIAYAKVEIVEASDMKRADLYGLSDPYVKGHLGAYRFRTKTQKKTLSPKWYEEFKIPIISWESPNVLAIEVHDKDHFVDDALGDCSVNISDFRDGQRHDIWLPLQNIKTGRLHLAITILEDTIKGDANLRDQEVLNCEDKSDFSANETANKGSVSSLTSERSQRVADNFESINVEGQKETGIWVHHPGSEISQTWEPRKGKSRRNDTEICGEPNDSVGSESSTVSGSPNNDGSSSDEKHDSKMKSVKRGLRKIGSVFHRNSKKEDQSGSLGEAFQSPQANIRAVNQKKIGVRVVVDENVPGLACSEVPREEGSTPEGSGPESPSKVKGAAKSFLKHAEKSAHSLKHALSRKGSRKTKGDSAVVTENEILAEFNSSDDESLSPSVNSPVVERIQITSTAMASGNDSLNPRENVAETGSHDIPVDANNPMNKASLQDAEKVGWPESRVDASVGSPPKPRLEEENIRRENREDTCLDH
ncbi:C2 domain containing protein [Quillaja saponaria]|uniref:C2 domain containing protein n=1 Tax=Quillaja saponaria TaxID=32244 RepID=A0AAD7KZT1_QUISA|nr:C2 domain containing protein [Quillaja saponaria]